MTHFNRLENRLHSFYNNFANADSDPKFDFLDQRFFDIQFHFTPGTDHPMNGAKKFLHSLNQFYSSSTKNIIDLLVQTITIPDLSNDAKNEENVSGNGNVPVVANKAIGSNSQVQITFLTTKVSIHETLFTEWLLETTSTEWVYDKVPFTKANIEVSMINNNSKTDDNQYIRYTIYGAYPTQFTPVQPNVKELGAYELRGVNFNFEFIKPEIFVKKAKNS